jgi:hypothetical protein
MVLLILIIVLKKIKRANIEYSLTHRRTIELFLCTFCRDSKYSNDILNEIDIRHRFFTRFAWKVYITHSFISEIMRVNN